MLTNRKIEILDSTLREGEQTPGVSFTLDQKIGLAKRLDAFGVDFIELGHPAVSPDVYEAVDALNGLELNAKKMAHGRAAKSDINDAVAIGVPWMGIFFGTSPISLKHKFNVDRKTALTCIETAVKYGKDKDPREDLFKYAIKNKWTILKMNPHTTNLEDIFRNLTMEGNTDA